MVIPEFHSTIPFQWNIPVNAVIDNGLIYSKVMHSSVNGTYMPVYICAYITDGELPVYNRCIQDSYITYTLVYCNCIRL